MVTIKAIVLSCWLPSSSLRYLDRVEVNTALRVLISVMSVLLVILSSWEESILSTILEPVNIASFDNLYKSNLFTAVKERSTILRDNSQMILPYNLSTHIHTYVSANNKRSPVSFHSNVSLLKLLKESESQRPTRHALTKYKAEATQQLYRALHFRKFVQTPGIQEGHIGYPHL